MILATQPCVNYKLVSGCETFSVLSHMKTDSKRLSIDMEALVGDPMNILVDHEVVLLLNQYGFSDLHGPSGKYLRNLKSGTAELHRQIVENEDYQRMVPQLKHAAHDPKDASQEKDSYGSGSRPRELTGAQAQNPGKSPRVFAPGGVSYERPKSDKPAERPEVTLRPNSANVGASAKHPAKARPESPAPKTMPEPSSSSSQRQPAELPLPTRRQTEGGAKPHMRANKATPLRQLSPRKPRSILKQEIRDGGVRATGTRAGERGNPVVLESRDVTVEDGSTMLLNLLHHWRENMRAGRSVGFTQLWANP